VGWHAHLLIQSPSHLGPLLTSALLSNLWHMQMDIFATPNFEDRLYWPEPLTGNYFEYATKFLDRGSEVDWANIVR
jgi:hypothetical protein